MKRKARRAAEQTAEYAAYRDELLKRSEENAERERELAQARFAAWQAWLAGQG